MFRDFTGVGFAAGCGSHQLDLTLRQHAVMWLVEGGISLGWASLCGIFGGSARLASAGASARRWSAAPPRFGPPHHTHMRARPISEGRKRQKKRGSGMGLIPEPRRVNPTCQKVNRADIWSLRGSHADVITPKFDISGPTVPPGALSTVWFSMLKASRR